MCVCERRNIFIQQGCIKKLPKVREKTVIVLQKMFISNKSCSFDGFHKIIE